MERYRITIFTVYSQDDIDADSEQEAISRALNSAGRFLDSNEPYKVTAEIIEEGGEIA